MSSDLIRKKVPLGITVLKLKRILIFVIFILSCSTLLIGCSINTKYDIERVFRDDTFKNIIEGKTKPVEIIVGYGGENGYEGFSTRDPAVIDAYIDAFRNVTIEEEIKDKDKMIQVWDGIVDFTFKMDDETGITVGTDLVQYVTDYDRGIQFKLGNTDAIIDLNQSIRE
jgi:hypothetical protein